MTRCAVVPCCLIVFLVSPIACFAQSKNSVAAFPSLNPSSEVVSVHDLQIPKKASAACNKGTERFAAKDYAGSIPDFQKAIKAFPDYYEAYAKLGAAEMYLERWNDAETSFRKSIELSDDHYAPADFGLALILGTVMNQFPEAESVVRAGLELNPANETGRYVLAWVLYSTSRLQEAEKIARETVLSEPGFAGARLLLAQIHIQENNPAAVVEDLNAYLALGVTGPWDEKVRAIRAAAQRALQNPKSDLGVLEASQ
jgi:tetratricopeptide (TPR) repeat protein